MGTFVNTNGEVIDFATGNVVGRTEGAPTSVAPRESRQEIQTQGGDRVRGLMNQASWGFNAGLFALPDLATIGIGKALGMDEKEVFTLGKFFNQGETAPRNVEERYARAIFEGVGAGMPITGGLAAAAVRRPMVAVADTSAGAVKMIVNDAIKYAQEKPRLAAATDIAFNGAYEALRQAVTETVPDTDPNKKAYEELLPSAAFIGLPLASQIMPSGIAIRAGKKAYDKFNGIAPVSTLEEDVLRGTIDPATGERVGGIGKLWNLPVVRVFPQMVLKRAEQKLTNVFGAVEKSPEAQESLRLLEIAMQRPEFAESGFVLDAAEKTMYPNMLEQKLIHLQGLTPAELAPYKEHINRNQQAQQAFFDSLAPEARLPMMEAFREAQAERQLLFQDLANAKGIMTEAELAAISERLGPQNMEMINDELRGALLADMEFGQQAKSALLNRLGLQQFDPNGQYMSTRDADGKSLFPSVNMEEAATNLVNKYAVNRWSARAPLPEPIALLRNFIKKQQYGREKLEKTLVKDLTNQAIEAQITAAALPRDIEDSIRSQIMLLMQGGKQAKQGKKSKRTIVASDFMEGIKTDAAGNVVIGTSFPGKNIKFNPGVIKKQAEELSKLSTDVDLNIPEALDLLTEASRFRSTANSRYNFAMSSGTSRVTDAQRHLNDGEQVFKDIEKLVMDHVMKIQEGPVINAEKFKIFKEAITDYNSRFQKNLPLLLSRKTSTGEFSLGNEKVMQRAFSSAENLKLLRSSLGDSPALEALLEKGAIDWLRSKNVLNADGLVDPKKIRRVLENNRSILEALPPTVQQNLTDEIRLADDFVRRMGELDQRRVLVQDKELDTILAKASRPDADPRQTLVAAVKDPATMRVLVEELGKDPDRLAALRRAVFDVANESSGKGGDLKSFIEANEKSLKVLFKNTTHFDDLKILADMQRRVNAFAGVTGQLPAFDPLDTELFKLTGSGISGITTNFNAVQQGRQSAQTAGIALMVRLGGALEKDIYKRLLTKALEDPKFAADLTHIDSAEKVRAVVSKLQGLGVPVARMLPKEGRMMLQEASQFKPESQAPLPASTLPVVQPTSAREQLRALPPAPPMKFQLGLPTTPPAGAGPKSAPPMLYPTLFPDDPISAMLQQRQQQQTQPGQQE